MRPTLIATLLLIALPASAGVSVRVMPVTPADTIHPNIHQNNGPGNNANPNGANEGGGNMHGIANNPGQSDSDPADGAPGFADQLETVHGGIGEVNRNAASDESPDAESVIKADVADVNEPKRGKPAKERMMFCHAEVEEVAAVLDSETGEVLSEATETVTLELKNLPAKAAAKHLEYHEFDSADLITFALDQDGDDGYDPETVVTACESPGDEFILIGDDTPIDDDDTPVDDEVDVVVSAE